MDMAEPPTVVLSRLRDPRADRGRRHLLLEIVTIAVLGVLSAGDSFTDMKDFGTARQE